ncbi:hypothetical protein E3E26_10725 [Thermococcus sp. LS1]|uniref:hypothetical protein n=1 Tax=Thermococcus sp. LS1 TaxID=1638259 RepID=UPI00143A5D59|nr:hypothetical protein [Thermococcus sp. LS1]NJE00243.1 hypothetical protein [Thermococcus sp. LS1]
MRRGIILPILILPILVAMLVVATSGCIGGIGLHEQLPDTVPYTYKTYIQHISITYSSGYTTGKHLEHYTVYVDKNWMSHSVWETELNPQSTWHFRYDETYDDGTRRLVVVKNGETIESILSTGPRSFVESTWIFHDEEIITTTGNTMILDAGVGRLTLVYLGSGTWKFMLSRGSSDHFTTIYGTIIE